MRNDYISYDADGFENQYNYTGGYVVSITPLNVTSDISAGNRFFVANDVSANGNLYVKNKLGVGINPQYPLDISGTVQRMTVDGSGKIFFPNNTSNQYAAASLGINGGSGDRLVLWPGSSTAYPYSMGINSGILWYNTPGLCGHEFDVSGVKKLAITDTGVGIGGKTPSVALDVSGQIMSSFPVHFFGYPTSLSVIDVSLCASNNTVVTAASSSDYYFIKFNNTFLKNWTPTWGNQYALSIPYEGLYNIHATVTLNSGLLSGNGVSVGIMKNCTNINTPGGTIAVSDMFGTSNSLSATAYLTTSDTIRLGFYASLPTSQSISIHPRTSLSISLIQRTA